VASRCLGSGAIINSAIVIVCKNVLNAIVSGNFAVVSLVPIWALARVHVARMVYAYSTIDTWLVRARYVVLAVLTTPRHGALAGIQIDGVCAHSRMLTRLRPAVISIIAARNTIRGGSADVLL
jgi:hypothetical protein